jgi:alginate O-acetyltransferase complex protein AlgI
VTFTSLEFLFLFMPLVFASYFLSKSTAWRNGTLFVASILFYAWGEPVLVLLMLGSVLFNWAIALAIGKSSDRRRRVWFIGGLVFNIAALFSFKYVDFLITALSGAGVAGLEPLGLPLPLGISFYSFQAIAYLIDLYRGVYPAQRSPVRLMLVIAAFPTVTAGPILRYKDMAGQLDSRDVSMADAAAGLRRILIGVAKKVLIANNVAYVATQVFAYAPEQYGAMGAWIGAIAWTLQIYFDFSGYTDIAVGTGRMFGFRYPENFNYPYVARSVSDFWRRWHMSLSSFFRDYVYIPLGGNRVSTWRWVFNMFVVWSLTGLWHGANWTFIVWGVYYGTLIVMERLFLGAWMEQAPGPVRHIYVLLATVAGWVMFMSPSLPDAGHVFAALCGMRGAGDVATLELMRVIQPMYLVAMLAGIVGSVPWTRSSLMQRLNRSGIIGVAVDVALIGALVLSLALTITSTFNPFLYVRF